MFHLVTREDCLTNPEDLWASNLLEANRDKYELDTGGLSKRYEAAEKMTEELFAGTPYLAVVNTFCVGCTVTYLYKKDDNE